jgi:hypothetical protein
MRARGGTRTAFQTAQTLGSRGNMRNPARSAPSTPQSEAERVHIVHTLFWSTSASPTGLLAKTLLDWLAAANCYVK